MNPDETMRHTGARDHHESSESIATGRERCSSCEQSYLLELEVRCYDCDSPLCPICVITLRGGERTRLCPSCANKREGSE